MKQMSLKTLLVTLFLFTIVLTSTHNLIAQTIEEPKNSKFNLHAGFGTNVMVSTANINFEYTFYRSETGLVKLNTRLGFGAAAIFWGSSGYGGLGGINVLLGEKNHHFETNAGLFVGSDYQGSETFYIPYLELGYRYQKPTGGFLFRAYVGVLGIGVGFGYAF